MSDSKCMRLSRTRQSDHGHRSNDQSKQMSHHLSIGKGQKSWYLRRPARRPMGYQVQAWKMEGASGPCTLR
jgi:hypothetical protein